MVDPTRLEASGRPGGAAAAFPDASWLPEAWCRLQQGELDGAAAAAREALARNSQDAAACWLMGRVALMQQGAVEAADWFRRALAVEPALAPAHGGLGEALALLGQAEAALASFERAVESQHDYVEAIVNMGRLHAERGHDEEAADCFHLAAAFDPAAAEPQLELARLARRAGRIEQSIADLERAAIAHPGNARLYFELGLSLSRRGDTAAAAAAYERAVALDPASADALINLGLIHLAQLGNPAQAERMFRRAAEIAPGLLPAQVNLGLALQEQGRMEEALAHYDTQLARGPSDELRWHRGIVLLAMGRFQEGWEGYEARKRQPKGARSFPYPDWDGTPLAGRTILIYGEQGVGDEIMFASCLPEVVAHAGGCVIECDRRLTGLYRRSFPRAAVHGALRDGSRDWLEAYPEIEVQSAIGSLPRFLRRSRAAFPAHRGYLAADPRRAAAWRERLSASGAQMRVGLAWRGGTRKTRGGLRSIAPAALGPLLRVHGAQFVSLQRGATNDDLSQLEREHGRPLATFGAALDDLDETAALAGALDLVVSVDCTMAHLTGALGRRAWVLLPASPDWRYPWQGETMPWYPSLTLMRQPSPGEWGPAIEAAAARLERIVAERAPGDNDDS